MKKRTSNFQRCGVAFLAVGLLLVAAVPAEAVAPAGKKYAIVLLLRNAETGQAEAERGCAIFTPTELCTEVDECGDWEFTEQIRLRNEWKLSIRLEADGEVIDGEGWGMTERRGPRSSIGGTFLFTLDGIRVNAGIAGTQVSLARCLEWAESDD